LCKYFPSKLILLEKIRETFEKCSFLSKAKEGENFNRRNTSSILRINPPKFGGGLKFEPDTGIGQKGAFFKGLWEIML
jgi:hypothetical protein